MRPLVLGQSEAEAIRKVADYADENRISYDTLRGMCEGTVPPPGDDSNYVVHLPVGFRATFSIEEQQYDKWARHLSMSVEAASRVPSPIALEEVAKLFGFTGGLRQWVVWEEKIDVGHKAINVLQFLQDESLH